MYLSQEDPGRRLTSFSGFNVRGSKETFSNENNEFCGLIGLGDELQHEYSNYSLGYWVRQSRQRKGIASSSVDAVLSWLNSRNKPIRIELTVHPHNNPGIAACSSICERWNGKTLPGFIGVEINGRTIPHILHLIDLPRG